MPQDLASELRAKAQAAPKAAAPPEEVERPWSVGGFAENAMNDAFDMVKGLFQMFPTAFKAGYDILSDPEGIAMLADRPEALGQSLKDTASALKDAIIEPYQKHGLGVVYHRPVSTLLDVLTVVDLGSSALARGGKIGLGELLAEGRQ